MKRIRTIKLLGIIFLLLTLASAVSTSSESEVFIEELNFTMDYLNPEHYNEETFPYWDYNHKFFNYELIPEELYTNLPYDSEELDYSRINYNKFLRTAQQSSNENIQRINFKKLFYDFGCKSCFILENKGQYSGLNERLLEPQLMGAEINPIDIKQLRFLEMTGEIYLSYGDEHLFKLTSLADIDAANTIYFFEAKLKGNKYFSLFLKGDSNNSITFLKNINNIILSADLDKNFFSEFNLDFPEGLTITTPILIENNKDSNNAKLLLLPTKEQELVNPDTETNMFFEYNKLSNYLKLSCLYPDCEFLELTNDFFSVNNGVLKIKPTGNALLKKTRFNGLPSFFAFEINSKEEYLITVDASDISLFDVSADSGEVYIIQKGLKSNNLITYYISNSKLKFENNSDKFNLEKYTMTFPTIAIIGKNTKNVLSFKDEELLFSPFVNVESEFSQGKSNDEIQKSLHENYRSFIVADKEYFTLLEELGYNFINFESLSNEDILKLRNGLALLPWTYKEFLKTIEYGVDACPGATTACVQQASSKMWISPHYFSMSGSEDMRPVYDPGIVLVHEGAHLYHFYLDAIAEYDLFYTNPFLTFPGFAKAQQNFDSFFQLVKQVGSPSEIIAELHTDHVEYCFESVRGKYLAGFYADETGIPYEIIPYPQSCIEKYGCKNVFEDVATIIQAAYNINLYREEHEKDALLDYNVGLLANGRYRDLSKRLSPPSSRVFVRTPSGGFSIPRLSFNDYIPFPDARFLGIEFRGCKDTKPIGYAPWLDAKIEYLWRMGFMPEWIANGLTDIGFRTYAQNHFEEDFDIMRTQEDKKESFLHKLLTKKREAKKESEPLFDKLSTNNMITIRDYFIKNIESEKLGVTSQEYVDSALLAAIILTDLENYIGLENSGILPEYKQDVAVQGDLSNFDLARWIENTYLKTLSTREKRQRFENTEIKQGTFKKYSGKSTPEELIDGLKKDGRSFKQIDINSERIECNDFILLNNIEELSSETGLDGMEGFIPSIQETCFLLFPLYNRHTDEEIGFKISGEKLLNILSWRQKHYTDSLNQNIRQVQVEDQRYVKHYYIELYPQLYYLGEVMDLQNLVDTVQDSSHDVISLAELFADALSPSLLQPDYNNLFGQKNYIIEFSIKTKDLAYLELAYELWLLQEYLEEEVGELNIEFLGNLYKNGFPASAKYKDPSIEDMTDSISWFKDESYGKVLEENYNYLEKKLDFD
ncbi:MAG: hypothetical protein H8D38_05795 [DPANN group archaeon]|nr:hypothetical protein [DPANN group archaeon]